MKTLSFCDLELCPILGTAIACSLSLEALEQSPGSYPKSKSSLEAIIRWLNNDLPASYSMMYRSYLECEAERTAARNISLLLSEPPSSAGLACYSACTIINAAGSPYTVGSVYFNCSISDSISSITGLTRSSGSGSDYALAEHSYVLRFLPLILKYCVEDHWQLGCSELVFENLQDEDKELFLYNINILK